MRSLFDRISAPSKVNDGAVDIKAAELQSIETELNRLLNARSYFNGHHSAASRTILNYGLEDVVSRGTGGDSKLEDVVRTVRHAIESYEPRIYGLLVNASYRNGSPIHALVNIAGRLRLTGEYVEFKVPLTLSESVG